MSRVIIVSNRLPISVKKEAGKLIFYPSIGGLATGLSSYVKDRKSLWIGWPGIASDELTTEEQQTIAEELAKHNYRPVFLNQRQIDEFYNGYSNSVLWPLLHNLARRPVDNEKRQKWWRTYREVNAQFAQAALNYAETGFHIWVHDYQLLLVPELLRAERADVITGLFMHIPFPNATTLSRLPEHKKLLLGMLGADVVGFHTAAYVNNFLENCRAAGIELLDGKEPIVGERTVRVADFPMGIDYGKYATATRSRAVRAAARRYRRRYRGLRVIVAVDRLDPTKGLVERLKAYAELLERQPRLRGKVVFSVLAAPSRTDIPTYRQLSKRVSALVGEINNKYGSPKWQPIDYMNEAKPFEEVAALFHTADVAFITPLRDGMNLVAKEFVASSPAHFFPRKRSGGVLILSETAGAAEELRDAILVNPKRPETLVAGLEQALEMSKRELRLRLRRMQQHLAAHTVQEWAKGFVTTLQQPVPGTPTLVRSLKDKPRERLLDDWRQAKKRLIFLDYDGSLVPFTKNYKDARPPKSLLRLLEILSTGSRTDMILISGRESADLKRWFGDLPITLVAEHGASVRPAGHKAWRTVEKVDTEWKHLLQPVLEKYAAATPGAKVEVKPHSLVWHYRAASPYHAQKNAVIIKRVLKPVLRKYGLELLQGNKALEIKNPKISKGVVARRWLNKGYDFVLAIGDDLTDEDLFKALPASAYGVRVGRGRTRARYRLASYKETLSLLRQLI
ncbi:MAG TPA: bifunctional alpha,alpha-trehalose-phosphate synthase (UDP-forming)/trehalose-phosphatase [Candidatus Dormibacteraeota bacterium]|nr:bifunctional alpha,alpha-trehalose-phosphate synthase (UDP-forming)/trehalose-phosphatase [Candidatus Dormibacteraeota bacterium]